MGSRLTEIVVARRDPAAKPTVRSGPRFRG